MILPRGAIGIVSCLGLLLGCQEDSRKEVQSKRLEAIDFATNKELVVVATVNGKSVYENCVRHIAQERQLDAEAALDHCIDFELLAQEANERGYGSSPEVAAKTRQSLVKQFVEASFVKQYQKRGSLPKRYYKATYDELQNLAGKYRIPNYFEHPAAATALVFHALVGEPTKAYEAAKVLATSAKDIKTVAEAKQALTAQASKYPHLANLSDETLALAVEALGIMDPSADAKAMRTKAAQAMNQELESQYAKAREAATTLHGHISSERHIDKDTLEKMATQVLPHFPTRVEEFFGPKFKYDDTFKSVVFAETPSDFVSSPFRTPWGYAMVRVLQLYPEKNVSLADAMDHLHDHYEFPVIDDKALPQWQAFRKQGAVPGPARRAYADWYQSIHQESRAEVKVYEENFAKFIEAKRGIMGAQTR